MNYQEKWKILDRIGEPGGQGIVYRVINKKYFEDTRSELVSAMTYIIPQINSEERFQYFDKFAEYFKLFQEFDKPQNQSALKVLNIEGARDPEHQKDRIKREIKAMTENPQPHLLKVKAYDLDDFWFASEYHPNGTLEQNNIPFKGKPILTLKTIKPMIEDISKLHQKGIVHRDIKPKNIFINSSNEMVLGDFGLVYFEDTEHIRLSNMFSNVGTHAWMPPWAQDMLLEKVNPTFDVFSLGKIIWSLISGLPILPGYYFNDEDYPQYNLEKIFPDKKGEMVLINQLLSQCIVEREKNCISDASVLLTEIDSTLDTLELKVEKLGKTQKRICKVCGKGNYESIDLYEITSPTFFDNFFAYACNYCGNTQFFHTPLGESPEAWKEEN